MFTDSFFSLLFYLTQRINKLLKIYVIYQTQQENPKDIIYGVVLNKMTK